MPATPIQYNAASAGTAAVSTSLAAVQVGDLIVVGCSNGFGTNPSVWTVTDSLGTTYGETNGYWDVGAGGGQVFVQWGIAIAAGACTVTGTVVGSAAVQKICIGQYRTAGGFDQYSISIQGYDPGGGFDFAEGTGPVTFADSLLVSFAYTQLFSAQWNPIFDPLDLVSATGDTLQSWVYSGPSFGVYEVMAVYDRQVTGPGNGTVILETTNTAPGNAGFPMVLVTFSKPVARPGGTTLQTAVRSGAAQDSTAQPAGRNINNPILASLPYDVVMGSFLIAAVSYNANTPSVFAVADTYGNVWTQAIISPGFGGGSYIALFYTVVTALPSTGAVFQATATFTVPGSGNIYQSSTIALLEQIFTGTLGAVQAAAYLSDVSASPNITLISSSLAVGTGDYLFAYAIYGGANNQESVAWTALESYTLGQQATFLQFPLQQVNAPRQSAAVLMSKLAPSTSSFDAQVLGTISGNYAESGSIALLSFPTVPPIVLLCPVSILAFLGVPYSAQMIVSGGTPPYTWELLSGPPWMSINSDGQVVGTPTSPTGSFSFSVRVTDDDGATDEVTCSVGVGVPCPQDFRPPFVPGG